MYFIFWCHRIAGTFQSTKEFGFYFSSILVAILFFKKGQILFHRVSPFCNFVRNRIYVLNETRFLVVRIAIYELFMISSDHCRKAEMG